MSKKRKCKKMSEHRKNCKKIKKILKNTLSKKRKQDIIHLTFYAEKGKIKSYRVEINNSLNPKHKTPSSEVCNFGNVFSWENKKEKGVHMTNVLDAAKFIVQLYYKTDEKYHCSRTKVEKLLAIANLVAFKNNDKLFEDDIWVNRCGVGIPILSHFLFSDIVMGTELEEPKAIEWVEIDNNKSFPIIYTLYSNIQSKERELLTDVFLCFGAYDALTLGQAFDEFKEEISVDNPKNKEHSIIDSRMAYNFFNENSLTSQIKKNIIVAYILNSTY